MENTRDIHVVIEQLKDIVGEKLPLMVLELDRISRHAAYTAPELMSPHWDTLVNILIFSHSEMYDAGVSHKVSKLMRAGDRCCGKVDGHLGECEEAT